ncbi:MAG: hypothetical protein Q8L27_01925 [archaeon]|nr:hypothetical protein [archaeon]
MCKGILQLKEENGLMIGLCNCGFKRTAGISISGEESNNISNVGGGVVGEDTLMSEGFDRICKKCGHDRADASSILSNESEVTIFTCLKCGFRERQSQGSKA